jgi:hypothetical protein
MRLIHGVRTKAQWTSKVPLPRASFAAVVTDAAVANAVQYANGIRVRKLPLRLEKPLQA